MSRTLNDVIATRWLGGNLLKMPNSAGMVFAVVSALGFGSLALWGKLGQASDLPSATLLALRFGIAGLLMLLFSRPIPWRMRGIGLLFGLGYTVQASLYFGALERISAGTTALLLYLCPVFVVLYMWRVKRNLRRIDAWALLLTSIGLVVIMGVPGPADQNVLGVLIGVAAGAWYAFFLLMSERHLGGQPPLTMAAHAGIGASLGFIVLGIGQGTLRLPHSAAEWSIIAGVALFSTVVAIPLMFAAVSRIGATRTSLLMTLEPVFSVVLAGLFLGEALELTRFIGGIFILLGAGLAQWPNSLPLPRKSPEPVT